MSKKSNQGITKLGNSPKLSYPLIAIVNDVAGVLLGFLALVIFAFSDRERDLLLGLIAAVSSIVIGAVLDRKRHFAFLEQAAIDMQHEIARKTILQRVGPDTFFSNDDVLNPAMASAASTIQICGITLGETIRTYGEVITERYKEGAVIEIIMLSKGDETLKSLVGRSWSDAISMADYKKTLEANANFVKQLVNVPSPKGKLTIYYLETLPTCGIILIDSELPTATGQVKYYKFGKKGANIFSLNRNSDPARYKEFLEEFENMKGVSSKEIFTRQTRRMAH